MAMHKHARLRVIAWLGAMVFSVAAASPAGDDEFVQWARARMAPLDVAKPDFRALDEGISGARLIGVGESIHESRTFLTYRRLLLEDLVRRHRVTALVLESGLPEVMALDDYVKGKTAAVDFRAAAPGLGGMVELDEAIEWLRAWNAGSGKANPVSVHGADLSGRAGSMVPALDKIRELTGDRADVTAAVDRVRPIAMQVAGTWWRAADEKYTALAADSKSALSVGVNELAARVEALPRGDDRVAWARQLARTLQHHEEMLRLGAFAPKVPRDVALAENTLWVLDRAKPGERVVYWAHNAHVQRALARGPGLPPGSFPGSGLHFDKALGTRYYAIGTAYGGPSLEREKSALDPASVDAVLGMVSATPFVLALREPRPAPVAAWLAAERPMRFQVKHLIVPPGAFDALVYFDKAEPATWKPRAN